MTYVAHVMRNYSLINFRKGRAHAILLSTNKLITSYIIYQQVNEAWIISGFIFLTKKIPFKNRLKYTPLEKVICQLCLFYANSVQRIASVSIMVNTMVQSQYHHFKIWSITIRFKFKEDCPIEFQPARTEFFQ